MAALVRSYSAYLGSVYPGSNGTMTVDATGANLLVLLLTHTAQPAVPPLVSFAGRDLTRDAASAFSKDTVSYSELWVLPLPPSGEALLQVVPGEDMGACLASAWLFSGSNGAYNIHAFSNEGNGTSPSLHSHSLAGTASSSAVVAAFHQVYGAGTPAASGWTAGGDDSGTFGRASDFTRAAGGTVTFAATTTIYAHLSSIIVEALDGAIEQPPDPPETKEILVTYAKVFVTGGVDSTGDVPPPAIVYDFMQPGVVPPTVTFSRASTAQYRGPDGLIHTAGVNQPAWQWDAAGNLLGAINEEGDAESGRAPDRWIASISSARYVETYERSNLDTQEVETSTWLDDGDLDYLFRLRPSPHPLRRFSLGPVPGPTAGVGIGGVIEVQEVFDCNGADLLLVALLTPEDAAVLPRMSYGGIEMFRVSSVENHLPTVGTLVLFALKNPPSGSNMLRLWADRFVGQLILHVLATTGASGQIGARWVASDPPLPDSTFYFTGTRESSRLFVFDASLWAKPASLTTDPPWEEIAYEPGDGVDEDGNPIQYGRGWIWTAPGGGVVEINLHRSVTFGWIQLVGLELYAALDQAPDSAASLAWQVPAPSPQPVTANVFTPQPNGQGFATYWESWMDREAIWPQRPLNRPAELADYNLTRVPPYVDRLVLHASVPRSQYQGLDSNVANTTGLQVPADWTGHELKAALALLRARRPDLQLIVSVFQITNPALGGEGSIYAVDREPYNPQGWGGMTQTHWNNIKRFVDDMGLDGIELDYECSSQNPAVDHHCWTDEEGVRRCYTDDEIVAVVKKARETFPRGQGYILGQSFWHVGCYGEGGSKYYVPGGYNAGAMLCLKRDPETATALDYIHLMSYDAGDKYDPIQGLRSVLEHFPDTPAYIGLRVGTPEWGPTPAEQPRRSLNDFRRYLNATIMLGAAGAHMYAMQWDLAEPSAALYSPTGDYGPAYPDGNLAGALVAVRYQRGYADVPLVGRRKPQLVGSLAFADPAGTLAPPPVAVVDWRVTEDGAYRITESGDRRRVE